jgi:hypothetical protein
LSAINAARWRWRQMANNGRNRMGWFAMQLKFLSVTMFAASLLLATAAFSSPVHKKRQITRHWHGYGFLPGYRSPERIEWERAHSGGPYPYYWDARPGFYRGRWNGGGFGPCWTQTPIGPMWNCGR